MIVHIFEVADGGSKQIRESRVLAGLAIGWIEEALNRSQTKDDGEVNRGLLQLLNG
jgi:hypothetical protein